MSCDRLITFLETGQVLGGRSVKSIRRMIARGELPKPVYVGRTPMLFLSDVVTFIEKLKEGRKSAHI
jgi:predicted DNA-binding transcriptional regulator AlpA